MYVEAKTSSKCVTLHGPERVLRDIARIDFDNNFACNKIAILMGNSMKIELSGDDLLFMKAALLEEVLELGFKLLSSINDDVLTLSREVKLYAHCN